MSFSNNFPTTGPSLELDFANVNALDPRITFTRSSIATVTNSLGLLQTVQANVPRFDYDPVTLAAKGLLIEEQRTNLLTRSEDFGNATWSKTTCTVSTDATTSPAGDSTADKLIPDVGVTTYNIIQGSISKSAVATTYTYTIYVKDGGFQSFTLYINDNAATANRVQAGFNISTVTTSSVSAAGTFTSASASLAAVGNGWYRCVLTGTSSTETSIQVRLLHGTGTGDGTSGLFIWGAQLETGSFATSYIPSTQTFTGRTSTGTFIGSNGLIQTAGVGVARMQYNPTNLNAQPFLLLEAAATNLLTYSEDFSNVAWGNANVTVTTNAISSPDGNTTADKFEVTTTGLTNFSRATAITGSSATYSIYAKQGSGATDANLFALRNNTTATTLISGNLNYSTGVWTYSTGSSGVSVTNAGNGWWRIQITATSGITPGDLINVYVCFTGGTETAGEFAYVWGAQLEANAFATSYIPTVATTGNRSADTSTSATTQRNADVASMTGTAFSSWYNQTEGTLFADYFQNSSTQSGGSLFVQSDGTNNNRILLTADGASSGTIQPGLYVTDLSAPQVAIVAGTGTIDSFNKLSAVYKLNDFAASFNGAAVVPDTGGTVPAVNRAYIGAGATGASAFINGTIRRITYYPIKLSSAQLQAITT